MLTISQSGDLLTLADNSGQTDEPLKLTLIPFQNVEKTVLDPDPVLASYGVRRGTGKWSKKPSVYGAFTEYPYGSVTTIDTPGVQVIGYPTERDVEAVQAGVICSPESGVIVMDVDDSEVYLASPLGKVLPIELAHTRRGEGGHIYIDARAYVGTDLWPTQGPIQGGDIKSAGYVAAAGSLHYSGDRYEPTGQPVVVATDEIMRALCQAKQEAVKRGSTPRPRTGERPETEYGHGDDHTMYTELCSLMGQGYTEAEARELWQELADSIQCRDDWPFGEADFRRHLRSYQTWQERQQARLKAKAEVEEQTRQEAQERLRAQRLRGLERAMEVRAQARRDAEERSRFMISPMNTALREGTTSCVPHADHEDGSQLVSGYGSIVTSLGKIAKIRKYEAELWSTDWNQQAPERLLALDILGQLKDGETVYASDPRFDEQRAALNSLLENHQELLGLTQDGRIVALQGEGEDKDHSWFCARCRNTHRLSHWEGLPAEIVLAEGCPLDTGIDVAHSRRGQERLVAVYVRLRQMLADKAKAEGRAFNPTKDRVTGRKLVSAWNEGERGEFACLSINKANRLLRKLSQEGELVIRVRTARNYLRKHRCRTASPVYGLPRECPALASPDPEVRAQAEEWLRIEDDLEWARFWMRRELATSEAHARRTAVAA